MAQRSSALAVLLVVSAAGSAATQELPPAENYHLRAEYLRWWPKLGGEVQKGEDGSLTNVTNDLGVPDESAFELRGTFRLGTSHKLSGSYTRLDYGGDVVEHPTVRYGSQTFFPGTRLVTSMKGGYYGAQYEWDLATGQQGYLGVVVGARLLDVDVLMVAPAEARREQESVRVWRPVGGATGRGYLGRRLSIAGTLAGFPLGSRGYAVEFDVSAQIHLFDRVAIKGGYRLVKVKEDSGSTLIEFRDNGGMLGVELSI